MIYRLFILCLCLMFLVVQPAGAASGAVVVAEDAKTVAANARAAAVAVADIARSKVVEAAAAAAVAKAVAAVRGAEAADARAAANVAAAEAATAAAEAKDQAATASADKTDVAAARAAADKAREAADKAAAAEVAEKKAVEAELVAITKKAEAEVTAADEANAVAAATRAEALVEQANAAADARIAAAEARTNAANAAADAAEAKADAAAVRADATKDAAAAAKDATTETKDTLADAKAAAEDAKRDLADAKKDLADAKKDLAGLQTTTEKNPLRDRLYFEWDNKYYFWQDSFHNSGYQFVQPYTFNYLGKDLEVGLRTNYIISSNKTIGKFGRVSTWGDSTLSLAHENKNEKYSVRYSLDVNMPTGKATLHGSQVNAIMNGNMVEFSRFGEGWNHTPGLSVSRKIGQEDTWTLGAAYAFRGKYAPDDITGNITPGGEWIKTLRWQHIGQQWQLVGELAHTSYGTTLEPFNGPIGASFRQGSETDAKLTYSRELAHNQNLMLYYWHSVQLAYSSPDPLTAGTTGSGTVQDQFFGAMWSKRWNEKYTFRVFTDIMRESGSSLDPLTDIFMSGGTKYSVGVGYQVDLAPRSRLSLDVARFYLRMNPVDGVTVNGTHGYNAYLKYFYDF